jgi:hypothetical protein
MLIIASELQSVIDQYLPGLQSVDAAKMLVKPSPSKWSKQEILGHTIDSAQNNIRRFIVGQYDQEPHIVYNQDKWVTLVNYQAYDLPDLINLWYLLNKHIVAILQNMPGENAERKCRTESLQTIEWLAKDYIKHLRHHMHQVLDLEPVAYP